MNHAEAVLLGKEEPTEEDFIEWVEEEAYRMGMIGFRAEYANQELAEIFADFPLESSREGEFKDFVDLENCAHTEMMKIHEEIETMKRRMNIMKANRLLCARAERRVDKELLAAGQVLKGPDQYPDDGSRFRRKVMELYDLRHPIPPVTGPPSGIDVSLRLGKTLDRRVAVRLPVEATLAEACKLLDGTCASEDYLTQGWHKAPVEKRIWKYCLRPRGQKSQGSVDWTRLLTDADYQHLIQQATKKEKGQYIQLATLTPDVPPETETSEETASPNTEDDFVPWNPLDENGEPYFDPFIDWNKVQFDAATGQVKEPDLDRIVRELEALPEVKAGDEQD